MSFIDDEDDLYEDFDDDDEDEEDDENTDDEDSEDEDVFETLEYVDTCQIMTRKEIIDDIKMYLRKYQPIYKIVRRKER